MGGGEGANGREGATVVGWPRRQIEPRARTSRQAMSSTGAAGRNPRAALPAAAGAAAAAVRIIIGRRPASLRRKPETARDMKPQAGGVAPDWCPTRPCAANRSDGDRAHALGRARRVRQPSTGFAAPGAWFSVFFRQRFAWLPPQDVGAAVSLQFRNPPSLPAAASLWRRAATEPEAVLPSPPCPDRCSSTARPSIFGCQTLCRRRCTPRALQHVGWRAQTVKWASPAAAGCRHSCSRVCISRQRRVPQSSVRGVCARAAIKAAEGSLGSVYSPRRHLRSASPLRSEPRGRKSVANCVRLSAQNIQSIRAVRDC